MCILLLISFQIFNNPNQNFKTVYFNVKLQLRKIVFEAFSRSHIC